MDDEQTETTTDNYFQARLDMALETFATEFIGQPLYAMSEADRAFLTRAMAKALRAADLVPGKH